MRAVATIKDIAKKQLQRNVNATRDIADTWQPEIGWIRTVRQALGMTAAQLARRLQLSAAAVTQMERKERPGEITIKQLNKAAAALNCRVVYALVPEKRVEELVEARVKRKAEALLSRVNASMPLENQGLSDKERGEALQQKINTMIDNPPRDLWLDD
jgi:predicted DNA-binding mobile mystery protein A